MVLTPMEQARGLTINEYGISSNISVPANSIIDQNISFSKTYTSAINPIVLANLVGPYNPITEMSMNIRSITNTGFIVRIQNVLSSAQTARVNWIAVGVGTDNHGENI